MRIDGVLRDALFEKRPNRYLAVSRLDGDEVFCHIPNPGRMEELMVHGKRVVLRKVEGRGRKTKYDLIGVYHRDVLVSIDSRFPNLLIYESLKRKLLEGFSKYDDILREVTYSSSRIDFLLSNSNECCLLEVKSCTLVDRGVAKFPDAPTERGRRHLENLISAKDEGFRACVLFLIQRGDVKVFTSNDETDPKFGETLRRASRKGVEIYAYSSEFRGREISLKERIEVDLYAGL
ncbi:MAG: DNA/RNA nuclease SfsA [Candidatus Methanofastidiosia archaeon]